MLRILLILTLIVTITSCSHQVSGIQFLVPVHTLERLGFNEGDLFLMLSADSSCKHEFGIHNYTVMFRNEGDWGDVRVWTKHFSLKLTRQEARQIKDEVHLCIRFKDKWESAWKGSYNLQVAYKKLFCNKESISSKWECIGCELCGDKRKEIDNFLIKYDKQVTPNNHSSSFRPAAFTGQNFAVPLN